MVRFDAHYSSVKIKNLDTFSSMYLLDYLKIDFFMKNLINSFSIFNLMKNLNKNLKENSSIDNEKSVHYRRDLDSLG